jgi:hypothetical protein
VLGSQPHEVPPAPKLCDKANTITESHLPEANSGPGNQEANGSQPLGALSDSGGQEPQEPEPMKVDAPKPLGGFRPF